MDRETRKNDDTAFVSKVVEQFRKSYDYYDDVRSDWEEKEAILINRNKDAISKYSAKSQIFDPRLSTIIFERMMRVMNQLSTGKVKALGKRNKGKSLFMDLVLHNYIEPNEKLQYGSILKKFRIENMYSHVYGGFGHLVDYRVEEDYTGPAMLLIPARDLTPQPGKYAIEDCQYCFVGSWVDKAVLKGLKNKDKWLNIDKLLDMSKGDKQKGQIRDLDGRSYAEQKYGSVPFNEGTEDYQSIYIVTRYEKDRWITFAPDYNLILRDIDNPHDNGKLPIIFKNSIPLVDRFWGLGEVERGRTLQYAINSLWALYLDGIKFSIFPPKLMNLSLLVKSTIKSEPAAQWVVKDINNAIREFPISPQGINSFQATYPTMVASLLNMAGTTDMATSSTTDPSLGKTPQALAMLNQRQSARDAFDREMQEEVIQETYDRFINLMVQQQESPVKINVFEEELKTIMQTYPDVVDMFEEGDGGEIVIKPEDIKGVDYQYTIDKGSTYKQDELLQKQEITDHLALALKLGDPMEMKQTGKVRLGEMVIDIAELFKRSLITGGMQDWDKVVYEEEMPEQPMPEQQVDPMAQGTVPQDPYLTGGGYQGTAPQVNFEDPDIQAVADEILGGR